MAFQEGEKRIPKVSWEFMGIVSKMIFLGVFVSFYDVQFRISQFLLDMKVPRLEMFGLLLITSISRPLQVLNGSPTRFHQPMWRWIWSLILWIDVDSVGTTTCFNCCDPDNSMWMLRNLSHDLAVVLS